MHLSAEKCRELLDYDPLWGVFTWREREAKTRADRIFNSKHAGREAGCLCPRGRVYIKIRGYGQFSASRLAWLHVTGQWPTEEIDHKDGRPFNNKFANLREASRSENGANRGTHRNSKSGVKGVYYRPDKGKWTAQIALHRKVRKLGYFSSRKEAQAAYAVAAQELHGEFARLS
jgi:hypothetical protein